MWSWHREGSSERKEFLEHLPCYSGILQIKCGVGLGKKIAGNSAVGVVVSHTRHRLASSVQGNREGQLFPFIHFELLKDHVKWERMLLLSFIRKNIK